MRDARCKYAFAAFPAVVWMFLTVLLRKLIPVPLPTIRTPRELSRRSKPCSLDSEPLNGQIVHAARCAMLKQPLRVGTDEAVALSEAG